MLQSSQKWLFQVVFYENSFQLAFQANWCHQTPLVQNMLQTKHALATEGKIYIVKIT